MAKELVVISGKGGTGKTSIVAAFASLARDKVMVDCDVDAADLHIILQPEMVKREDFSGGKSAFIRQSDCTSCGKCYELCRFGAVIERSGEVDAGYEIDRISCEGCGVCAWFCPEETIDFTDSINGEWYVSTTRFGKLVHAQLGVAEENSGKLVTRLKVEARDIAREDDLQYIIIDGSPGIGCPVIASMSGASHVLIVTEPTMSAMHDLKRTLELASHFNIKASVCINKWDINPEMTDEINDFLKSIGIPLNGKIRYDKSITDAQVMRKTIDEYTNSEVTNEINNLWDNVMKHL